MNDRQSNSDQLASVLAEAQRRGRLLGQGQAVGQPAGEEGPFGSKSRDHRFMNLGDHVA